MELTSPYLHVDIDELLAQCQHKTNYNGKEFRVRHNNTSSTYITSLSETEKHAFVKTVFKYCEEYRPSICCAVFESSESGEFLFSFDADGSNPLIPAESNLEFFSCRIGDSTNGMRICIDLFSEEKNNLIIKVSNNRYDYFREIMYLFYSFLI